MTTPTKRSAEARKADKAYAVYINGRLEGLQMNPMPGDEWPLVPVFVLPAAPEDVERMRDLIAEEVSLQISAAYVRGSMDGQVVNEKREDYLCADVILKRLGLTPAKKTKAL